MENRRGRHTVSAPPVTAGFPHFPAVPWNSTRPPASREAPLEPRRIPQLPQARPAEAAGPTEKHGKPAGTGVQTRHRPPIAGFPCFPAGPWNSPRAPPSREAPSCLGEFHSSRRRRRVHISISEGKKARLRRGASRQPAHIRKHPTVIAAPGFPCRQPAGTVAGTRPSRLGTAAAAAAVAARVPAVCRSRPQEPAGTVGCQFAGPLPAPDRRRGQ